MKILKILGTLLFAAVALLSIFLYESDIPKDVVDARYTSPASQFLELGENGRIHYRDEGNRRNDALVLLHGSNASLHTWEPWVEQLSSDYRVVSLDFPAHGLTGEVPNSDYSVSANIKVVEAIVEHLDIDSFVLVGNSMGGSVAWRYALQHPQQLKGLVLIATGGLASWRQQRREEDSDGVLAFELLRQPFFRSIGTHIDPYYFTVQGVKSAYNNSDIISDELIMRYYDLNLRAGTRNATMIRFGQRRQDDGLNPADINTPTLLMWGDKDTLVSMDVARKFEETIPTTRTAYYENVGHIPMEEIAQRSANDLIEFLESLNTAHQPDTVGS